MNEQIKCPKCGSLRILLLRNDCDWGSGDGYFVNDKGHYHDDDDEGVRDMRNFLCLGCDHDWKDGREWKV